MLKYLVVLRSVNKRSFIIILFLLPSLLAALYLLKQRQLFQKKAAEVEQPINWTTSRVSLLADDFYIIANGNKFVPTLDRFFIYSNTDSNSWTTLTASWRDNGIDMRINIYINTNETDWWSNIITTDNGKSPSSDIYYTNLQEGFFQTRHGNIFSSSNITFNCDINNQFKGKIYFKNIRLQTFFDNPAPIPSIAPLNPTGEQKVLVIMYNFQDDPDNKPFTKEAVYNHLFKETESLNAYFKEVSYGTTWLTGEITDWFTIPYNTGCIWNDQIRQYLKSAARESGINVDSYHRFIYITLSGGCSDSTGTVDGNPSETHVSGTLAIPVFIHEIGHNLGIAEANSLTCGSKTIDTYNNCISTYYGDPFSPMGRGSDFHHNAFHKTIPGWIPESRVKEATVSGNYQIYPLETSGSRPQVLKIAKPDSSEYYYLEYRQPLGYDRYLGMGITRGALLHIGYFIPSFYQGKIYNNPLSYLLDTTPKTLDGFNDAALSDGASFHDEINNITITQISHDANLVTLAVILSSPSPTPLATCPLGNKIEGGNAYVNINNRWDYFTTFTPRLNSVVNKIEVKAGNWIAEPKRITCRITNETGSENISIAKASTPFNNQRGIDWREINFRNNPFFLEKGKTYRLYCRGPDSTFNLFWLYNRPNTSDKVYRIYTCRTP